MMRYLLSLFTFVVLNSGLFAQMGSRQTFFELQFGAGPTFMLTDIGNPGYGLNLEVTGKYRLHPHIALKAGLGGALGFGTDQTTGQEDFWMEYYSILTELTGQIEFYLLKEGRGYGRGGMMGYKPRVRPYLYAGGGPMLYFPAHTHDNAEELPDFSRFTVILVGGAGFRYRVNADLFWGMQVGVRMTTTDFLEGYSPDDSPGNDNYISMQALLVHRF